MSVSYDKLWKLLIDKKMNRTEMNLSQWKASRKYVSLFLAILARLWILLKIYPLSIKKISQTLGESNLCSSL